MTGKFPAPPLSASNNLIPPSRIDWHKPDLSQLIIQRSDRHFPNNIVSPGLVAVVDDLTLPFLSQDRVSCRRTVHPLFGRIDDSAVQNEKRFLNLGYKLPYGTRREMRGIDVQASLEPLITFEEFRLQGHGNQKQ
jgi:hypothetical protein